MSEAARQTPAHESGSRTPGNTAPLRDWLAAMRATAETRIEELRAPEPQRQEPEPAPSVAEPAAAEPLQETRTWAPRLVTAAKPSVEADDELAEIMAENLMLKAQLRIESERRDELQAIVAQEIRDLRAHIAEEVGRMEDLRAERDLWRARCEALASPLFQTTPR